MARAFSPSDDKSIEHDERFKAIEVKHAGQDCWSIFEKNLYFSQEKWNDKEARCRDYLAEYSTIYMWQVQLD